MGIINFGHFTKRSIMTKKLGTSMREFSLAAGLQRHL